MQFYKDYRTIHAYTKKYARGDRQFHYHLLRWHDICTKIYLLTRNKVTAANSRVFSFLIVEFLPVNICKPQPSSAFAQFANFFSLVYDYCWKPEKSVFSLISGLNCVHNSLQHKYSPLIQYLKHKDLDAIDLMAFVVTPRDRLNVQQHGRLPVQGPLHN